jgi:hypothetical protein
MKSKKWLTQIPSIMPMELPKSAIKIEILLHNNKLISIKINSNNNYYLIQILLKIKITLIILIILINLLMNPLNFKIIIIIIYKIPPELITVMTSIKTPKCDKIPVLIIN